MAEVITKEESNGRSYVRRVMKKLAELGLAETNGKDGKHPIWNLTPAGQKALADGNELPPRPKAGTGAKAVRAGFGPHGVAVTDTILAYTDTALGDGHAYLTDWQVEVNHAIKETGLSFNTDAVRGFGELIVPGGGGRWRRGVRWRPSLCSTGSLAW
ncbi:replication-relaxation family protein [Streptomyces olivochromogenes]|uniref:Uncharacterized protein n=1 Tax=Streptomyces olivochromogenes TaxID=1963 RepID=A0A250VW84_STROL|nr:replication-relaxation family protein [Streptomyces olivochromogenes]KUN34303.1 hypothetical protein AQJ27_49460 [Streptomyces olivochromogenes]GAX58339.1 hypothetical protein SO3561_09912 [Streptomyces olivochromogenes]